MSPQFVVSPSDLQQAFGLVRKMGNPVGMIGRFAGLGEAEQQAGIPAWSLCLLALGAGLVIGVQYGPTIRRWVGR